MDQSSSLSWADVAKHNSFDDCWVVVDGIVYDVTKFVPVHPGGRIIMQAAGRDATAYVYTNHAYSKMQSVKALLRNSPNILIVGKLSAKDALDLSSDKALMTFRKQLEEDLSKDSSWPLLNKLAAFLSIGFLLMIRALADVFGHWWAAILLGWQGLQPQELMHLASHKAIFKSDIVSTWFNFLVLLISPYSNRRAVVQYSGSLFCPSFLYPSDMDKTVAAPSYRDGYVESDYRFGGLHYFHHTYAGYQAADPEMALRRDLWWIWCCTDSFLPRTMFILRSLIVGVVLGPLAHVVQVLLDVAKLELRPFNKLHVLWSSLVMGNELPVVGNVVRLYCLGWQWAMLVNVIEQATGAVYVFLLADAMHWTDDNTLVWDKERSWFENTVLNSVDIDPCSNWLYSLPRRLLCYMLQAGELQAVHHLAPNLNMCYYATGQRTLQKCCKDLGIEYNLRSVGFAFKSRLDLVARMGSKAQFVPEELQTAKQHSD